MRAFTGKLFIEGDLAPEYAVQDVGGDPACGEARHIGLGQGSWTGHFRPHHSHRLCQLSDHLPAITPKNVC
jgi:hypothetical protein